MFVSNDLQIMRRKLAAMHSPEQEVGQKVKARPTNLRPSMPVVFWSVFLVYFFRWLRVLSYFPSVDSPLFLEYCYLLFFVLPFL